MCESCFKRKLTRWYAIDNGNADVELCRPCAKALEAETTVEPVEV